MRIDAMSGYIKLWRELFAKPIWTEASPGHRSVMMEILGLSVWKPTQFELMGKLITLQPGQLAISSRRLAETARVDRQVVKTALKRLENYHFLTQEVTQQGIVITLVNWGKYQANPEELTHAEPTNKPTANPRIRKIKNYGRL